MDHRPFEDWLLDNQTLTPDQKRQLDAHLRTCSSCCSLAEVNLALKSVRMAEPAAGFADRFQLRLEAKKKTIRRRNFIGFFILTVSVLSLLVWISWPVLKDLIQSPANLLASWLSSLVIFWAGAQAMIRAAMVLFKVVPGFVPAYVWTVILLVAGGWSVVWVFSLVRFTKITSKQGV
jgi:hypothetical protein